MSCYRPVQLQLPVVSVQHNSPLLRARDRQPRELGCAVERRVRRRTGSSRGSRRSKLATVDEAAAVLARAARPTAEKQPVTTHKQSTRLTQAPNNNRPLE